MELKQFQLNAVKSLFQAMEKPVQDIILKSPTGSGKTIILTYFDVAIYPECTENCFCVAHSRQGQFGRTKQG